MTVRFALCHAVVMGGASLCGTSVLVAGCGSSGPGTTVPDGAASDAAPVADAGTGRDGNTTVDANDASAGPCAACEPSSPCETAECIDDICVREPLEEGTSCGEASICVASECVERGCGDGYVEPGPTPPREQCDPGADVPNDGCSATCEAEPVTIYAPPVVDFAQRWAAPAVGVDGAGRVLFTWTLQESESSPRLLMGRIGTGGEPFEIGRGFRVTNARWRAEFYDGEPTVSGLDTGGWVVTWPHGDRSPSEVRYRVVAPDGSLGSIGTPHGSEGRGRHPQVAGLANGFVLVWESGESRDGNWFTVARARVFDADGAPLGPEIDLDPALEHQRSVHVASQGSEWVAVWLRGQLGNISVPDDGAATLRRFDGTSAIDDEAVLLQDRFGDPGDLTELKVSWGRSLVPVLSYTKTAFSSEWRTQVGLVEIDSALRFRRTRLDGATGRRNHSTAPLGEGALIEFSRQFYLHGVTRPDELATMETLYETGVTGRARLYSWAGGVWITWGASPGDRGDGLKAFHIPHP
jgi:cysteine-rich repeat protein